MHFKSKLLETGEIFSILNSVKIKNNGFDVHIFSSLFLSYSIHPKAVKRVKCPMFRIFTVIRISRAFC